MKQNKIEYEKLIEKIHLNLNIPNDYESRWNMPIQYEEKNLKKADININGEVIFLSEETKKKWLKIKSEALMNGISLFLKSGYRSLYRQSAIIRKRIECGDSMDDVLEWVAAPGHSEHHTGRAMDIGTMESFNSDMTMDDTKGYYWLHQNKNKYGIELTHPKGSKKITFEPWHWYLSGNS